MSDLITLPGIVLSAMPIGEYDKRVVLLTQERGRISAFARGARRPRSYLLGPSRPMAFGTFDLYEGRSSYNLEGAQILDYFDDLSRDLEGLSYGSYFLEVTYAYSAEGVEASQTLELVYQSLKALSRPQIPRVLTRYIFELRTMVINGVYSLEPPVPVCDATEYTIHFIAQTPVSKLYTFTVSDRVLDELGRCMDVYREKYLEGNFTSLDILKSLE